MTTGIMPCWLSAVGSSKSAWLQDQTSERGVQGLGSALASSHVNSHSQSPGPKCMLQPPQLFAGLQIHPKP